MTRLDEQTLVVQACEGDAAAFEQLFRTHHVRVYNLVRYVLGDGSEAEDVTQQAFVRAWEELPRIKETGAFAGWLNRIAVNLARDLGRSPARREQSGGGAADEAAATIHNGGPAPEERLAGAERDEAVHEAIASLPEYHREVVLMHHIEGAPVRDVAQKLGVPVGTVLSRLARARDTLRRRLTPYVEQ